MNAYVSSLKKYMRLVFFVHVARNVKILGNKFFSIIVIITLLTTLPFLPYNEFLIINLKSHEYRGIEIVTYLHSNSPEFILKKLSTFTYSHSHICIFTHISIHILYIHYNIHIHIYFCIFTFTFSHTYFHIFTLSFTCTYYSHSRGIHIRYSHSHIFTSTYSN